jgi:putative ABC transport system permease protein
MSLAHRIIARVMPPDVAEYVIGDLIERDIRGARLWRETAIALWSMNDNSSSGGEMISAFLGDLRHGARILRRSPAFTIVSVLTLGLGIGATTAIFSIINPVILEPLPYPNPDRLALVWQRGKDGSNDNVGFATFRDFVDQSTTIERAAAIGSWLPIISGTAGPERVRGDRVSWTYFQTLGVRPAIGRDFLRAEDAPDRNQVVILSHGLWARAFGSDTSLVGRTISIGGGPMTVVGIMPAGFQNVPSPEAQIWRVLGYATQPWACRTCHHLRMIARLKPGVTAEAARAELDAIHGRLAAAFPREYSSVGASIVPVNEQMTKSFRPALFALAGAVVVMLMIAVANVSSMLLARTVRREEEFAVRTALGAGRSRLTRQLLAEGLLLATLGGAAGLAIAAFTVPVLVRQLPPELPRLSEIHLSGPAFLVAAGLILLSSIVAGLIPTTGRSTNLGEVLRSGRRTAGGGRQLARSGLVVVEVGLALMLLVGCGLLARSVMGLLAVNPGFKADHLLTLEINSVGPAYAESPAVFAYHDRVREAVSRIQGVQSVAIASQIPLGGNMDRYGFHAMDKVRGNPEESPSADRHAVSIDFLRTMGIPLTSGRDFLPQDATDTTNRVVIISDGLARLVWPGENPLGKVVKLGGINSVPRRVIGTVGNVHHEGLDAAFDLQTYIPERQWSGADDQVVLVVRTEVAPEAIASTIRRAIREIDPTQPIVRIATMDQLIAVSTSQRRLALVLFAAFAGTALLLAIAGIYGVLAGRVAERTREIGLRSALGATPRDILGLVVGQGMRLGVIGLVLGLAGSWGLSRFLRAMLFGVEPNDPTTLAAVAIVLGLVTVIACVIPASRALSVAPTEALRSE